MKLVLLGGLAALLFMYCPCQPTPTPQNWPTGAGVVSDSVHLLKGGYSTEVEFQLYYHGEPYLVDGFVVEFTLVDRTIASFPDGTGSYETTTVDGRATATVVSGNRSGTTHLNIRSCNQQLSKTVRVTGYGSISGFVTDTHQQALPGAIVTLWPNAYHNATTGSWEHDATTALIDPYVDNNPQAAGNGSTAPAGTYTFSTIPLGIYLVEADASAISGNESHRYFAVVNLQMEGSETANVVIPGNVLAPTPTATATGTQVVTTTKTATSTVAITTTATPTTSPSVTTQSGNTAVFILSVACLLAVIAVSRKKR